MIKTLLFLLLLFSSLVGKEYPEIYSQLGTPLYKSLKPLLKLSAFEGLNGTCSHYISQVNEVRSFGTGLDISNKAKTKEYLLRLRELQKEYDKTLYHINIQIDAAIDKDNYKRFLTLVECDVDGILKSRIALNRSIKYYKQNRAKKKSSYFEEKINYIKLLQEHEEQVYNESKSDSFDSSKTSTGNKKVFLEAKNSKDSIKIYLHNKNFYTITMSLDAEYKGLKYDKSIAKEIVVKAKSTLEYIELHKSYDAYSYSVGYRWIIGSVDAVHDDTYLYSLPYKKGTSHRVSQGFDGKTTHFGRSKYAVDFSMKIGTEIYAARDGVVVRVKSNSDKRGVGRKFSKYANYINIEHSDGTIAMYYHLKKGGVAVKVGQSVKRGELIGYSGNTGYSTGPHLHFGVFKASSASRTQTVPIKFITLNGEVDDPKRGVFYKAK